MKLKSVHFAIGIFVILNSWPFSSYASETRAYSMGGVDWFIKDNLNIIPFPATLMDYQKEIRLELRLKDEISRFSGQINMPLKADKIAFGLNVNRLIFSIDPFKTGDHLDLTNVTDLLAGTIYGSKRIGLRFSYGADSYTSDVTSTASKVKENVRYFELAAGLSDSKYDFGLHLNHPRVSNSRKESDETWRAIGIGLTGRYFFTLSENMQFIPLFLGELSFGEYVKNMPDYRIRDETDRRFYSFTVAGALQYQIAQQTLILLGCTLYSYQRETTDERTGDLKTTSYETFPAFNIGVEAKLVSYLLARFGVYENFKTTTTSTKPFGGNKVQSSSSLATPGFTFGLGIELHNFMVDVDINKGIFFEGGYAISGKSRDIFNRLSITYKFNE